MHQEYAQIEVETIRIETPFGHRWDHLPGKWIGAKHLPVRIDIGRGDGSYKKQGNRITGFPWPLLIVASEYFSGSYICVRLDASRAFYGRLWAIRYRLRQQAGYAKSRCLWTLHIWGLAECEHGSIPQWSDIKRPRWLKGRKQSARLERPSNGQ